MLPLLTRYVHVTKGRNDRGLLKLWLEEKSNPTEEMSSHYGICLMLLVCTAERAHMIATWRMTTCRLLVEFCTILLHVRVSISQVSVSLAI